jgi:flagellar assembly protein FliH
MTADSQERRPFLFEHDFGEADIRSEEAADPEEEAAPTFSEDELETAKNEAYQMGHTAGFKESNDGFEHRIAESLDVATGSFSRLAAAQAKANENMVLDGLKLSAKLVQTMMPKMIERHGATEIEAAVTQALQEIIEEPSVTVTVHSDLAEKMADRLQAIAQQSGLGGKLSVTEDDSMGLSDCRVSWGEGGAERNADAVWAQAEEALERNLPPNEEPEAPAPVAQFDDISVQPDATILAPETAVFETDTPTPPSISQGEEAPQILDVSTAETSAPPTTVIPDAVAAPSAAAPDLPGAVAVDLPGAVAADLPGAVAADLPGAVAPGLPGTVTTESDQSKNEGNPA